MQVYGKLGFIELGSPDFTQLVSYHLQKIIKLIQNIIVDNMDLCTAAHDGDINSVRLLLEGADVNEADNDYWTPLPHYNR